MEKIVYYSGVLRIKNPKTLQRWVDNGSYKKLINQGFIFNVGCGRFRKHICTCTECRNKTKPKLKEIINNIN